MLSSFEDSRQHLISLRYGNGWEQSELFVEDIEMSVGVRVNLTL